jgi:hypothetical protein
VEIKQFRILVAFELFNLGFEGLDLVGERFAFVLEVLEGCFMVIEFVVGLGEPPLDALSDAPRLSLRCAIAALSHRKIRIYNGYCIC